MTAGAHVIPKTGPSLAARVLGALVILVVVVVSAYFALIVFEPHIGNVLAVFLIFAGFFTLVAMIAESVIGKK